VNAHERFEQPAVVRNPQVQEFVGNHEVLEACVLLCEVGGQREDPAR